MEKDQSIKQKMSKLALLTTMIVGGNFIIPVNPTLAQNIKFERDRIEIASHDDYDRYRYDSPVDIFNILLDRRSRFYRSGDRYRNDRYYRSGRQNYRDWKYDRRYNGRRNWRHHPRYNDRFWIDDRRDWRDDRRDFYREWKRDRREWKEFRDDIKDEWKDRRRRRRRRDRDDD